MTQADVLGFQTASPAVTVERAVAELRFGRPVVLKDGASNLAVLALDSASPDVFNRFAATVNDRHSLLLTAERSESLGLHLSRDIAVSLSGMDFDATSRLAYALEAKTPSEWQQASPLMSLSATLARTALLLPAMVCADIEEDDARFAGCHRIDRSDLFESADMRQKFEMVVKTRVPLKDVGDAEFAVFRGGLAQKDQVAIIVGKPDVSGPVPVRIHSSCITGDLFGSLKCDCGDQLRNGLVQLKEAGGGVLVYLDQEGRGTGIGAKMRAYGYQHKGLDTIDADAQLGLGSDHRRYEAASTILNLLNIEGVVLYTNNPSKIEGLRAGGIKVDARVPVTGSVTAENANYLRTKAERAGHILDLKSLIAAE